MNPYGSVPSTGVEYVLVTGHRYVEAAPPPTWRPIAGNDTFILFRVAPPAPEAPASEAPEAPAPAAAGDGGAPS